MLFKIGISLLMTPSFNFLNSLSTIGPKCMRYRSFCVYSILTYKQTLPHILPYFCRLERLKKMAWHVQGCRACIASGGSRRMQALITARLVWLTTSREGHSVICPNRWEEVWEEEQSYTSAHSQHILYGTWQYLFVLNWWILSPTL